ncbi:hypothetical protein [Niallia sp. NCCP-28]|uniref:hypothetical protein n=1 Tax=Niallia sp. NCCP-28 TaxID=2934712 RepID=UPI00208AA5BE|nr:hypothetical protein [Niallia sp. NCCP-28]GKU82630.1 hypothetical protein NCCP28_20260 [Niallia sp. NCCP-28]
MRKVNGIKPLIVYLNSLGIIYTEEEIGALIKQKMIPHQKPIKNLLIFDLDHIDWWIEHNKR